MVPPYYEKLVKEVELFDLELLEDWVLYLAGFTALAEMRQTNQVEHRKEVVVVFGKGLSSSVGFVCWSVENTS